MLACGREPDQARPVHARSTRSMNAGVDTREWTSGYRDLFQSRRSVNTVYLENEIQWFQAARASCGAMQYGLTMAQERIQMGPAPECSESRSNRDRG